MKPNNNSLKKSASNFGVGLPLLVLFVSGPLSGAAATEASNARLPALTPGSWQTVSTISMNGNAMPSFTHNSCVNEEATRQLTDPNAMVAMLEKNVKSCQFTITSISDNKVSIHTDCKDPHGFVGKGDGQVIITNSKTWNFEYAVDGTMTFPANPPAGTQPISTPFHSDYKMVGSWLRLDCGPAKPPTPSP